MGMRLFVCEYVTGGGLSGVPLPLGLCREGDMMLGALVKALLEIPGIEVAVTRDRRLPEHRLPMSVEWIDGVDPWPAWRRIAREVDAVWPIAPETGGALARLTALVLEAGSSLIGSRPEAVRVAGSKRLTADRLTECGVPAVPCWPGSAKLPLEAPNGWVVKPDDGAGTEDTLLFRRRADLGRWLGSVDEPGRFVVQPYLPGEAASLSMLCRDGRAWLLSCNRQDVVVYDGRFAYRGGIVGGLEHRRPVYEPIADAVAAALPDLWGHVGADLVDTGTGPVVLEVNPRLTTSFVGLQGAVGENPAALALDLLGSGIREIRRPLHVEPCMIAVETEDA